MRVAICLLLSICLLAGETSVRAGIADYSDRGKIDFDTAIQLLNPYGTWSKIDGLWAFTPIDRKPPYTSGRWLYTEYGWYWQGTRPHSWATEHYGFWKRGADHVWSWFPGATWLPQIVEIRMTSTHIGWRCAEVDGDGAFVEAPEDRFAKIDEWNFVSREQFTRPITPNVILSAETTSKLLDDSSDSTHTYVTYRAITRPGPHPADLVSINPNGGMFPPSVSVGMAASTPPTTPAVPTTSQIAGTKTSPSAATNAPASGTNADSEIEDDNGAPADIRQVPYWITMSLPSYWTRTPADAQPNQIYIYRPDLFQDQDGIERRITLWINPATRTSLGDLRNMLGATPKPGAPSEAETGTPAAPVSPSHDPFRNPFDESFHEDSKAPATNSSSKAAPSGLAAPSTNAAPGQ